MLTQDLTSLSLDVSIKVHNFVTDVKDKSTTRDQDCERSKILIDASMWLECMSEVSEPGHLRP